MWICFECGNKHGKPKGGVSTYHTGICEWCGKEKAVTEDRDFNYPPQVTPQVPRKENKQ